MSFIKEFKAFISKGSVVDLAVAVVIGAAFGKIVTSAVNDILMPVVGIIIGGVDFSSLQIILKNAVVGANGAIVKPAVVMNVGTFIQESVNFILIAFFMFIILKGAMRFKKKEEVSPTPAPSEDVLLLREIRDLLKNDEKNALK